MEKFLLLLLGGYAILSFLLVYFVNKFPKIARRVEQGFIPVKVEADKVYLGWVRRHEYLSVVNDPFRMTDKILKVERGRNKYYVKAATIKSVQEFDVNFWTVFWLPK